MRYTILIETLVFALAFTSPTPLALAQSTSVVQGDSLQDSCSPSDNCGRADITAGMFDTVDSLLADKVELQILLANLSSKLSRAESAVLLDAILVATDANFGIPVDALDMPFGDVSVDSGYRDSLLRLSNYYGHADNESVFTRTREVFNPLMAITRQEFLKIVLQGFDIVYSSANDQLLGGFVDVDKIAPWAVKYFKFAVKHGILTGKDGYLLPNGDVTVRDAKAILNRVLSFLAKDYRHGLPGGYKSTALPDFAPGKLPFVDGPAPTGSTLKLDSISIVGIQSGKSAIRLAALTSGSVPPDYKSLVAFAWQSPYGVFEKVTSDASVVDFYPTSTSFSQPIYVKALLSDGMRRESELIKILDGELTGQIFSKFGRERSGVMAEVAEATIALSASRLFPNDKVNLQIDDTLSRNGIQYGAERLLVRLEGNGELIEELYSGALKNVQLSVGFYPAYFGQALRLRVFLLQNGTLHERAFDVDYFPTYEITGTVYGDLDQYGNYVTVDGEPVLLSDSGQFIVQFRRPVKELFIPVEYGRFVGGVSLNYKLPKQVYDVSSYRDIFMDTDHDGVPDKYDKWPSDPLYTYDFDNDGLPNEWETRFGLNPNLKDDAGLDGDGDGYGNLEEFLAGTDPTDKSSHPSTPQPSTRRLNDTGITTCSDNSQNGLPCPVSGFFGQDAERGRDRSKNDDGDGHAGFSFTKLDANGKPLPASATTWSCVKDNVTGLVWEIKTDDGGLRDKDWGYSWYEPNGKKNGGFAGYEDPYYGNTCNGTLAHCNTRLYVLAVKAQKLCGYGDWRLPSRRELQGLVALDRYAPAIDTAYFPETQLGWYWSSSPVANHGDRAWVVYFYHGYDYWRYKYDDGYVRLVRGGQ